MLYIYISADAFKKMDFRKIKNLVKQNGDKFIFVENGEPELVVMSFQEYEKLNGVGNHKSSYIGNNNNESGQRSRAVNLMEKETEFEPPEDDYEERFTQKSSLPVRLEDIRLEDLPI